MVFGTYANLNAIDEKSSGSFEESESILKHEPVDRLAINVTKHLDQPAAIQIDPLVTPAKLDHSDLKDLPDQFETLPKSPDSKAEDAKYHENPVDGLDLVELQKDTDEVKLIPLDVVNNGKPDASKKSNDINNEAIQKEEQEIAIEKKEQDADDSQSELKRLEATKKLLQEVKDMKSVLEKQNQETQQLVLQKFDEIVDKVEKIEKVQEEDNKKHEEEKAEKMISNDKNVAEENVGESIPLESGNVQPIAATNETINLIISPIVSMLINKPVNPVEPSLNNSQETNVDSKPKSAPGSREEVEHVPIQRDLLNFQSKKEMTDQSINVDESVHRDDLLRHKRDASDEDCTKRTVTDGSESLMSENGKIFHDAKLDLADGVRVVGSGRDLKSVVQDK